MPDSVKATALQSSLETVQWSRDGIHSWLVCLAALYALAATWGTSASSARALLLPRLEDLFKYANESDASTEDALVHTKTAAVYSVHNGLANLMVLPATFLVHHVGCRLTLLVGFALSSAGSAVAALWPHSSLWVWWLGFGAATGTGNALVYIASLVVVEQSFDRHFGAASSLVCLGSTCTLVFLPHIWSALLGLGAASEEDKLKGTETGLSFVMFSLCLNLLVCIPMLPLFASPFFIAARQLKFRLTRSASNTSSDSINSISSMTKILEDGDNYCKRVFFKLFDFPTPGYKYSSSKSLTIECIIDNSSNDWSYQLRLVWRTVSERNFFLFIVVYAAFSLFNAVPDTYSESTAEELFPEDPDKVSTLVLNSYGLGQLVGKVVAAPLLDRFPSLFGRTLVVANGIILKGLVTGAVPVSIRALPRLEVMLALYASQGVCDGLHCGGHSALIHSLVGSERYAIGLSISALVSAPAVLAGSQLDGLARDLLKEYSILFAVGSGLIVLTGVAMLLFRFERDPLWKPESPPPSSTSVSLDLLEEKEHNGEHNGPGLRESRPPAGILACRPQEKADTADLDSGPAPETKLGIGTCTSTEGDAHRAIEVVNEEEKVCALVIEQSPF